MTREPPRSDSDPTEPLWTSEDVMNYLRISRTTLWTLVKKQGLPAFKIPGLGEWRYRRSEIDAWIASQRGSAN
jgi:excisionase family DNA binding protein